MKNNKIWLGILAMTLAFGITVVSCSSDDGDGPTGGNAFITGTADGSLSFTNQRVWEFDSNDVLVHYQGGVHQVVCSNFGGTGNITNGMLTFTLADATGATLEPLEDILDWLLDDLTTITVTGVEAGSLSLREDDPSPSFWLDRSGNHNLQEVTDGYNFAMEGVEFIYVDSNVTVSHPGATLPPYDRLEGVITYTENITIRAFRVYLQQGWNALRWQITGTVRETSSTTATSNETWTIHVGNPANFRWVIY